MQITSQLKYLTFIWRPNKIIFLNFPAGIFSVLFTNLTKWIATYLRLNIGNVKRKGLMDKSQAGAKLRLIYSSSSYYTAVYMKC